MTDDAFAEAFRDAFPVAERQDALVLDPLPDPGIRARTRELEDRIARDLATTGPAGWHRLDAVFALTHQTEFVRAVYRIGERSVDIAPSSSVLRLVREHRELAARMPAGPWWRFVLALTDDGELSVDYDYGDKPFPDEHRFPPEAYRADLADFGFPSEKLPTWLAAYVSHRDRQLRSPRTAAARVRADAEAGIRPVGTENELPALPVTWARWATLSAAFVAIESDLGPRIRPSQGRFEGSTGGGSTLWLLPGDRAVLSGGVWDAPELAATYRGDAPFPDVFAGAPDWVTDAVLDARGASGLMSFCYWWVGGRWCRGESPRSAEFATAVPGVWTAKTVTEIIASLVGDEVWPDAADLVLAADAGRAERDALVRVFGRDADIDGAFQQLVLAGVVASRDLPPITEHVAIGIVREHMLDNGLDSPDYSVHDLTASRVSVGWMVYVPVPKGEIAIWRTIFYVADDGVLERATSATAPSVYEAEFEQRYRERRNA